MSKHIIFLLASFLAANAADSLTAPSSDAFADLADRRRKWSDPEPAAAPGQQQQCIQGPDGVYCKSGETTCSGSGLKWAACQGEGEFGLVVNATEWWYKHIYPHIPDAELQYYTEPFGGATQPTMYRGDLVKQTLHEKNEVQGVEYKHLRGGRTAGARAPLHRHDFSATTHVLQGYVTLFLEGHAPKTYAAGESYYMPPGGLVMSAGIMPNPVYNGRPVVQSEYSINIDTNANPIGARVTDFVEIELRADGSYFDWRNGRYERCAELPRYACQRNRMQ